jgi:hypothetical protein
VKEGKRAQRRLLEHERTTEIILLKVKLHFYCGFYPAVSRSWVYTGASLLKGRKSGRRWYRKEWKEQEAVPVARDLASVLVLRMSGFADDEEAIAVSGKKKCM